MAYYNVYVMWYRPRLEIIVLLTMAFLCVVGRAGGQDTKLPHPFMWKSFNNPGYSGFDGISSVNIGIRRAYWSHPLDFRTYFVSADYPFRERHTMGLGGVSFFYQRDQEGSLMYVTNTFALALSTRIRVSQSTVLQLGIQPALYRKSLDPSRIRLGDQFDPYYGQILDLSPELMEIYAHKLTMFDIAAGIYGETDFALGFRGLASLEYGFSVYHLIESTQSFLSEHGSVSAEKNLLNRRYSAYLSYAHPLPLGNRINTVLSPYMMADIQSVMKNFQFGLYWEEERFGMIGLGVRSDQYEGMSIGTVCVNLGVNLRQDKERGWKVGYTFEMPAHQGTMYKNTSHSLSLHWYFKLVPQRCVMRFDNSPNNYRRMRGKRSVKKTFKF